MKLARKRLSHVFTRTLCLSLVALVTFTSIVLTHSRVAAVAVIDAPQPAATVEHPVPKDIIDSSVVDAISEEQASRTATDLPSPTATSAQPDATITASPNPAPSTSPQSAPVEPPSSTPNPAPSQPDATDPDAAKPDAEPDTKPEDAAQPEANTLTKTPEERDRFQKLAEADRLYKEGNIAAAEKLYRTVKAPFAETTTANTATENAANDRPQAFTDPEQLSPGGRVFWRESEEGIKSNTETRIFVPLKLLIEKHPEFVPGHLRLAEQLEAKGKQEEAANVLDQAASLYPDQPELVKARIALLIKTEQWLEASIAARQFALLNPDDPLSNEFTQIADENLKRYQGRLRSKLTGNLIGNIVTGALGVAITGNPFLALSSVQTTVLLLRGESAVGERFSSQAQRQLDMMDDKETVDYVNGIGKKLAAAAGRDEFKYEFYVVQDEDLNAFALPGGKIFVNAGSIAKTNSEAELAGLLGHELSHAVLSHGFQLVTESSMTANVFQFVPYVGGLLNNLVVLNYSRDMERQADILGTRLLVATNYAADGMRNLMVTLDKEDKQASIDFLSSHPVTRNRVNYLETLIQQSGYNRYAYEGVEQHAQIQQRVNKMLAQKKRDEKERDEKERDEKKEGRSDLDQQN